MICLNCMSDCRLLAGSRPKVAFRTENRKTGGSVTFPLNVYLLAVLGACATTLLAVPLWMKWCRRTGLVDEPGGRKIHDRPIPLAGGPGVMTGLLAPTLCAVGLFWWQDTHRPQTSSLNSSSAPGAISHHSKPFASSASFLEYGLHRRAGELAGIFLGAAGMLAVGWLDDKRELRPGVKFAGQLMVATLVAICGVRITLFVPSEVFHYGITLLWILTVINAFNFMDNMNGLCAGLAAIGAWCFASVAAAGGQYLVALIAFLTFGALLGFLPYNFPRARAFLGDGGSHLVGYLLAVLAILPHFYTPRHPYHSAVLIPLFALALPLLDLARVVIVRWRIGQPFYQGDTNHLSHLLVRSGLTRTRAVLLIWLAAALLAALTSLF